MARVVVGLSGGVDSAAAAYLLKKEGHQVIGATLRTWEAGSGAYSRCCDISDARRTAMQLEIPYYNINSLPEFCEHVTEPFMKAYVEGLTPNPCVACNRYVKWERMLRFADEVNAEFIATGHYAGIVMTDEGRYTVKQASEAARDQTYMLYMLTQDQLKRTLMPLAGLSKDEVRRIAAEAGLDVAGKSDSQEICFVIDGGYADYISSHYEGELPPPGDFLDTEGNIVGRHRGIINYTVGQRKGLGIALGHPVYVKEIDPERNAVILGDEGSVRAGEITVSDLRFMSIDGIGSGESIEALVKIRYHHPAVPAVIERTGPDEARICFREAVKAPAPGQAAVFYDREMRVMGGGTISKNRRRTENGNI